ncbi:Aspartic peptidase domain superfamily [Sesbania bispinosa]|nr:Aspartic peptidase domain superfamily [Sesbania bispinosa]
MVEKTCLKELTTDVKRILELMMSRDRESNTRFETLEAAIDSLLKSSEAEVSSSRQSQSFRVCSVKLDFPCFDGADVLQWIFKAEQFFNYYNTPDDQRLTIAAIHLDKEVVPWFQMMAHNNAFQSWFAALANRVTGLISDSLLDCFIGGLKPDIRQEEHHLSYNSLHDSSGLGTMKFQGLINGMTVQVLLDGGSSDNFIQPRLAHCLKLPVKPIQNVQVVVRNGAALTVEGWIRELEVQIQGHSLELPIYFLPVSGADLVRGVEWLATLGPYFQIIAL